MVGTYTRTLPPSACSTERGHWSRSLRSYILTCVARHCYAPFPCLYVFSFSLSLVTATIRSTLASGVEYDQYWVSLDTLNLYNPTFFTPPLTTPTTHTHTYTHTHTHTLQERVEEEYLQHVITQLEAERKETAEKYSKRRREVIWMEVMNERIDQGGDLLNSFTVATKKKKGMFYSWLYLYMFSVAYDELMKLA